MINFLNNYQCNNLKSCEYTKIDDNFYRLLFYNSNSFIEYNSIPAKSNSMNQKLNLIENNNNKN